MARSENIKTKRLLIVPFGEEHLTERYLTWLNDKELMKYSEQRHRDHDMEECCSYLKSFDGSPNYFWALEDTDLGVGHVGNITAFVNKENRIVDVGIMIGASEVRKKGYGIEAWLAVCDYLFNNLPIRKLTAGTLSLNKPMLNIMKLAGMVEDGVRRKHFIVDGQEVDIIYAALFREQWKSRNSKDNIAQS